MTIHAEYDVLRSTWVEIILGHEIEKFPEAFSDLIHELGKRYASGDQTLTGLARLKSPKTSASVPDDYPRGDVFHPYYCLLRHHGPFLSPKDEFSRIVLFPRFPPAPKPVSAFRVYGSSQGL